ncbi:hypothetical protein FRX31_030920, partial [Thalictrum thalictroides]
GSSFGNPGRGGYGVSFRDNNLRGVEIAKEKEWNWNKVWVESDSNAVVQAFGNGLPPWQL